MFDDEKIADANSMSQLANNYAMHNVVKSATTSNNQIDTNFSPIWAQYTSLINELSKLSQTIPRRDFREYFSSLITQNQQELQSILNIYPALDQTNAANPIFNSYPPLSTSRTLRSYIIQELRIIQSLSSLLDAENNSSNRVQLAQFINRHIENIITLLLQTYNI